MSGLAPPLPPLPRPWPRPLPRPRPRFRRANSWRATLTCCVIVCEIDWGVVVMYVRFDQSQAIVYLEAALGELREAVEQVVAHDARFKPRLPALFSVFQGLGVLSFA